ncbi:hypothetical protein [Mycoplasma suis]|uniref:hypothetical protein n=1 Tax=Mycoplasma suis TaxID=57372 RepID=UPI0002FC4A5C|nr:hypothetical protein [Mycoplasma suis]
MPLLFGAPSLSFYLLKKDSSLNPSSLFSFSLPGGGNNSSSTSSGSGFLESKKSELDISNSSISSSSEGGMISVNNLSGVDSSISIEEDLELFFEEEFGLSTTSDLSVTEVYKEMKKNLKTVEIQTESSQNLQESQEKLNTSTMNFNSALESFKKWQEKKKKEREGTSQEQSRGRSRGKRSVEDPQTQLSKDQREALLKFYKEFCQLTGKKTEYSEKLDRVQREAEELGVLSSKESEIIKALEKIGWGTKERITFGEYLHSKVSEDGTKDPFDVLLGEEYSKKAKQQVIDWERIIENFKKNLSRQGGLGWLDWLRGKPMSNSGDIFQKEKEKVEDDMVMEISRRLLEIMFPDRKEEFSVPEIIK